MTASIRRVGWISALLAVAAVHSGHAQGRLEDYRRAEQFVAGNITQLMQRLTLTPHWLDQRSDRFWYVDAAGEDERRFVLVDARKGTVEPAFDHARLAAALSASMKQSYQADQLPFKHLDELTPRKWVAFAVSASGWRCDLQRYTCARTEGSQVVQRGEVLSPDGRWAVSRRDDNLFVRDRRDGSTRPLTTDGVEDNSYAGNAGFTTVTEKLAEKPMPAVAFFSPDSTKIFSYRLDTRDVRQLQVTKVAAGGPPVPFSYAHPLPGDPEIAKAQLIIFDVLTGARLDLARSPLPVAGVYESLIGDQMRWSADSRRVFYVESSRGYKHTALHVADAVTGADRIVAEERSDTYVAPTPTFMPVRDGHEVVWSSERSGWNHLYRVDASREQRQLTSGEWVVFDVLRVDAETRWVYFTAGGREPGRDPYYRHLYRVSLDGGEPQRLTPEDADHTVEFSMAGNYFVDTFSRMDLPPTSVLRAADGRLVRQLHKADISKLTATGWRAPERFVVKSGDGVTDLYGVIYRPSNFDPSKRYPVIDSVYPGPQIIVTPKSFSPAGRNRSQELPLAELGFIVINLDGKGTPLRSRAFREAAYGKLGYIGGMDDHLVAFKELAKRHPYMDLERVGIFGHSGGGYASARALLMYPDFYKVAVASNGNHDARAYWAAWGERYQGYPVDASYDAQSNVPLAGQLKGKLLLAAGAMDDNVNPSHTLVLANALIAANKDFDLLILPNRNHGMSDLGQGKEAYEGLDPYFVRRRWDYFVRHLMGVEPPHEYRIEAHAS